MRIGVILPTFSDRVDEAVETARRAEELGLDGVFCYDHLWPMGQPERPALAPFPVLGLLASTTSHLVLGTLVARVGLVPDAVLVSELATLGLLAPGRVVAGLGTGDHLSAAENRAYGIDFAPAAERRAHLRRCAAALVSRGITVWLGGRRTATSAMAEELGAAVNLWDVSALEIAQQAADTEVTWAGPATSGHVADGDLRGWLDTLRRAGASWAVLGPPAPLDLLASVAGG